LSVWKKVATAPVCNRCFCAVTPQFREKDLICIPSRNPQCYLPLTGFLQNRPKIAQCFLPLTDTLSRNRDFCVPRSCAGHLCYLPLTSIHQNAPKTPQCFLPLTAAHSPKYQCYLPLKKKGRGHPPSTKRKISHASNQNPKSTNSLHPPHRQRTPLPDAFRSKSHSPLRPARPPGTPTP
jgi:hypothetical protein